MTWTAAALAAPVDVRNPDDIVADSLALLAARMPAWIPRNGSVEVELLEAVALAAGEVAAAADAAVGSVVEAVLATLHQVPRSAGSPATGVVAVTLETAQTLTVPAGTRLVVRDWGVELLSTGDVAVTGSTSVMLPVATSVPTAAANGVGAAALLDLLDPVPGAVAAQVVVPLTGGVDPESDAAYTARASARLARLSTSLGPPDSFTAYAVEDVRVGAATTVGAWDGAGTPGAVGGHVLVATYGRGGQVGPEVRDELAAGMRALAVTGVAVHVVPAVLVPVDVTATVHRLPGTAAADVQAACVAALRARLDPQTWAWGTPVRPTQVLSWLAAAAGVDYPDPLAAPTTDVPVPVHGLACPGTLAVSVL